MKNNNRTSDDMCLICLLNKADKKGSHFTPAGIIKKVIGDRDYEELYSLNNTNLTKDIFFGRSNLQNPSTQIKKPSFNKKEGFFIMLATGIEPATSCLPCKCSTY